MSTNASLSRLIRNSSRSSDSQPLTMDFSAIESCGIIVSPNTDQKIKSRIAAMRLKHGAPQFKDVLRKRFRDRVKKSRSSLVDRFRSLDDTRSENVMKVIQEEVSNLLKNGDLRDLQSDAMEEEISSEEEHWWMQHYDLLMADDSALQQLWEESQLVVCPVCKRGNLTLQAFDQSIRCDMCPMMLPARATLSEIEDKLYQIIGTHDDEGCQGELSFFVSNEDASLYAHCNICSYFDLAV